MGSGKAKKKGPMPLPPLRARARNAAGGYHILQNQRERFRAGRGVAVAGAWSWGIGDSFKAGASPCRLASIVNPDGDRFGQYRPHAKLLWSFDHSTAEGIDGFDDVVPPKLIDVMRDNPDVVLESNLASQEKVESILTDLQVIPLRPSANGDYDVAAARASACDGQRVCLHAGTIVLKLYGGIKPVKVLSYRAWTEDDRYVDMLAEEWQDDDGDDDPASKLWLEAEPAPLPADRYNEPVFEEVPLCGGPAIGSTGQIIMAGRSPVRMFLLEYRVPGSATKFASVNFGVNLLNDEYDCTETLTVAELEALPSSVVTNQTTRKLLSLGREKRSWLCNPTERVLGWRKVTVRQCDVQGVRLAVNLGVAPELALLQCPTTFDTFEVALGCGGAVQPLRRVSEGAAVRAVQQLNAPTVTPLRLLAQSQLQQAIIDAAGKTDATDPLQLTLPFPYLWLLALCRAEMQRSCDDHDIITFVFRSGNEFKAIVGFDTWPAPTNKSRWGMQRVSVPPIDEAYADARNASLILGVRNVWGVKKAATAKGKHELNELTYNLSMQMLSLTISVATFANSKRVKGASMGQPPPGLSNPKFVLGLGFVDRSTPAPTPAMLQAQFARPAWNHWAP